MVFNTSKNLNNLLTNKNKGIIMKKVFLLFYLMVLTGANLMAQDVNVTFQVDMRVSILGGYFNPATDVVTCPGAFNNWLNEPPANTEKVMSDADNDSVYSITISMAPNTSYGYKFNIGLGWDGKDEKTGDRTVNVGASDMTVDPAFFSEVGNYTGVSAPVTFNIDMRGPLAGPMELADHVYIAGNFTDWGTSAVELTDTDGDSVYSGDIATFTSGDIARYKFIWSTGAVGSGNWETPEPIENEQLLPGDLNRLWGMVDGTNEITRLWENKTPGAVLVDGNILFTVDMSVATELGVFNPNADSVQIRGEFNGWGDTDPTRALMNQSGSNPDLWFLNIPMVQLPQNDTLIYKFFIKNDPSSTPYSNTGWEVAIVPTPFGNRDRPIEFMGEDNQQAEYAYFEGVHTDWVIPTGTTVEATFTVDMTTATGFNPVTDTVLWIPRQPFYYAVNGLEWPGEYPRIYVMTDANSDMVYEGTLIIDGPNFNGFLYNYGYANAGGLTQEAGSQGECRVRYIAQTGPRSFVSPYTMEPDVWTDGEKPEETPPTSVEEISGVIPNTYSLEQNYPNPFNPSTMIRFSIPEQGLVTLKVYNLLGEEIATLLNSELKNGTYEVDFNAANYSSGIYFYTINANNYIATKKMILMK